MNAEHDKEIELHKAMAENENENLRKDLERNVILRENLEREVKKLKRKSHANLLGGWGTFSIVFEDNSHPRLHHLSTSVSPNTNNGG